MRYRRLRPPFVLIASGALASCTGTEPPQHATNSTSATPDAKTAPADTDMDDDRIADKEDLCPKDPEDVDGFNDRDGCPDNDAVPEVASPRVVITNSNPPAPIVVRFAEGSVDPTKESLMVIDEIAKTLASNPQVLRVAVVGHDDARSPSNKALSVSKKRAETIVDLLVKKGIDSKRLVPVGAGRYCLVDADNHAESHARNRRIEFKVLETNTGPTEVEVLCEAARTAGIVAPK